MLGTIIFLYGGLVFIRGAQGELRARQPGMMTLISLATVVAFVTSWAGTLGLFEIEIWWVMRPTSCVSAPRSRPTPSIPISA